jgi:hypothetical protein
MKQDIVWSVLIQVHTTPKPVLKIDDRITENGFDWIMEPDEAIRVGKALMAAASICNEYSIRGDK